MVLFITASACSFFIPHGCARQACTSHSPIHPLSGDGDTIIYRCSSLRMFYFVGVFCDLPGLTARACHALAAIGSGGIVAWCSTLVIFEFSQESQYVT